MPLRPVASDGLASVLRRSLSTTEDPATTVLVERLRAARRRGYLTPGELEAVCRWKSARAIQHIRANSAASIRSATRRALTTRNEQRRLEALCSLQGVSVPMASALLTLLDPRRYGVLDIRVWQLLHALGLVRGRPGGTGFGLTHWLAFLTITRDFAQRLGVTARDVERTLFAIHRDHQQGLLYARVSRTGASGVSRRRRSP